MSRLRHIPQSSFRRMPWKNGGGETIEIAAFPESASLETFVWRVSMAHVAKSGPFSAFPGIDRTLLVLEGSGIILTFSGRGSVPLEKASAPYSFPADMDVFGSVTGDGITDLNVMTRRGIARHHVSRIRVNDKATLSPSGPTTLIISLESDLACQLNDGKTIIPAGDLALIENTGRPLPVLILSENAEIFVIDIWH